MNIFYADDGGDDVVAAGDGGWNCRKDRRSGCFRSYCCRGVVATAIDAAYSSSFVRRKIWMRTTTMTTVKTMLCHARHDDDDPECHWAVSSTFHSKSSRHEKVSLPQPPSMI